MLNHRSERTLGRTKLRPCSTEACISTHLSHKNKQVAVFKYRVVTEW
jgi:hypothetical protein